MSQYVNFRSLVFTEVGSDYVKVLSQSTAQPQGGANIAGRDVMQLPNASGTPNIATKTRLSATEIMFSDMVPGGRYTFREIIALGPPHNFSEYSDLFAVIITKLEEEEPDEDVDPESFQLVSWLDTDVPIGHYWYRSVVSNGDLQVETNHDDAEVTGVEPQPLDAPDNLRVTAQSKSSIALAWNSVVGAAYYRVEYSSDMTVWESVHTAGTSWTHNRLPAGVMRYYRVYAVNAQTMSNASNVVIGYTEQKTGDEMIKKSFFSLEPNRYYWFQAVLFYDDQEIDQSGESSFTAAAISASAVECKFEYPEGIDEDAVIGWYINDVGPVNGVFEADDFVPLAYTNVNGDSVEWNESLTNSIEYNINVAWLSQPQYYSVTIAKIGVVASGKNPLFLARIERGPTTDRKPIRPQEVQSIKYSVLRRGTFLHDMNPAEIEGHQTVNVPVFPWILEEPVKDYGWREDAIGYNFIHCIDRTLGEPFPTPGNYEVTFIINLNNGNSIAIKFQLNTVG